MPLRSVILLAGGLGTRVRALYPNLPKPMIPAHGKPFLEWVMRYWREQGTTHVVVSLGHQAEVALEYLAARPDDGLRLEAVSEPHPLGTGGAIRFAAAGAAGLSDPFFVANADSLVVADLGPALARLEDPRVDGALLSLEMADTSRYGSLAMDEAGFLTGLLEKQPRRGWINAGVYLFRQALLERFPEARPLSMETQVFPALVAARARLVVVGVDAPFLDMGTPQALARLDDFVAAHCRLDR